MKLTSAFNSPVLQSFAIPYVLNRCKLKNARNGLMNCMICFAQKILVVTVFLLLLVLIQEPGLAQQTGDLEAPQFVTPTENIVNAGYIRIRWMAIPSDNQNETVEYELQQSTEKDFGNFRVKYKGVDLASYVSGLPNGTFYYRIKAIDTATGNESLWSAPIKVDVVHHSLTLAFWLMGIGSIVFFATAGVIWHGTRSAANEQ
ncbi:MAG: hypothetical protein KDE52_17470 [Calditrichaeota bacterium]|nr:hypothetical protein [Calditrichota bacterium]MCB0269355.1 hypothetical protein [Calditrichota bacterium]MCB0301854.1 hypothetical protein [Calditrichota bacterium]MCB9067003.1 hypothetical protein [Calditrichia bacterium]